MSKMGRQSILENSKKKQDPRIKTVKLGTNRIYIMVMAKEREINFW